MSCRTPNRAQLELVLALTRMHGNVMAVGDPDQGIYGFRGARTGNVDRFRDGVRRLNNDRPRAAITARSRRNRRREPVVGGGAAERAASVGQVAHRRARGAPVRHVVFGTPEAEADGVAAEIERRIARRCQGF